MESQKVSDTIIEFIREEVKERNSYGVGTRAQRWIGFFCGR